MLLIISLMAAGILLGAFVFSHKKSDFALKIFWRIQQVATVLLLFMMGVWLGSNPDFWSDVKTIGLHGFLFAAVTIAGSVFFVFLFSKIFSRGKKP